MAKIEDSYLSGSRYQRQTRLRSQTSRLYRLWVRHRRISAAVLAGLAVFLALVALRPPDAATSPVVVATRDVAGGRLLSPEDVEIRYYPPALVPAGAVASLGGVHGARASLPLRAGEPVTDVRLVSSGLLQALPGRMRAVPVPVSDSILALLRPGDQVDLLSTADPQTRTVPPSGLDPIADQPGGPGPGTVRAIAEGLSVLLTAVEPDATGQGTLLLAVPANLAERVAAAGARGDVILTIQPR